MACKRYIVAALTMLCIAACTPEYELKIPLALNRTEMRFRSTGDSYYVMVSCAGAWTAELDGEAPWLSLSRTEGGGNAQIMVTAEVNDGVSRGVTMTVRSGDLSREMYISQAGGLSDGGSYGFVKSSLDLLREACTAQIRAGTNMDAGTL